MFLKLGSSMKMKRSLGFYTRRISQCHEVPFLCIDIEGVKQIYKPRPQDVSRCSDIE